VSGRSTDDKQGHLVYRKTNGETTAPAFVGIAFALRLYAVLMARAIAVDSAFYGFMARDFLQHNYVKVCRSHSILSIPYSFLSLLPTQPRWKSRGDCSPCIGTGTLLLVYYLAKEVVSQKAAAVAASSTAFTLIWSLFQE